MKKALKQKWLTALRGRKFKQGKSNLCEPNPDGTCTHCCLGVLAEVAGVAREKLYNVETLSVIRKSTLLGPNQEWGSGHFDTDEPETHTNLQRKLAAMNDNGRSFKQIANWIEKNVPTE